MNCRDHPLEPLIFVCIAQHKCQRKLCASCQYLHEADKKEILPNQLFLDLIQKKAQQYKLNWNFEQQRVSFKKFLSNFVIIFQNKIEEIFECINKIYQLIEQEDQFFDALVEPRVQVSELSYEQLDLMVNLLQNDRLQNWNQQKQSYVQQLDILNSWLKDKTKKFIAKVNEKFQGMFWEEKTYEYQGLEMVQGSLVKTQFQINQTKKREHQYIINGEIIQTILYCDLFSKPQIIENLEEMKHLQWIGEYGNNFKKVGLWKAKWKGKEISGLGGLYLDGKKQGKWKETIKNYFDNANAYEIGYYKENQKIGSWKYVYNDKEIGGGEYNSQGQRQGYWIELGDQFRDENLVTNHGQYQNGQKVSYWNLCLIEKGIIGNNFRKIGGGNYLIEQGNSIKIGKWIEINDRFKLKTQILDYGIYGQGGNKVGVWDVYEKKQEMFQWLAFITYESPSNIPRKTQRNKKLFLVCQSQGEKKVGRWDIIMHNRNGSGEIEKIGGGFYDTEGNQNKIGKWVELYEGFQESNKIFYSGQYNMQGTKVERWDVTYCKQEEKEYQYIGGGSYSLDGNQRKIGKWVELVYGFYQYKQVTYNGEYNIMGMKIGRWNIMYCKNGQKEFIQIGGGSYDQEGNQKKIGQWVDLDDGFYQYKYVTYNGEYNLAGIKIGRWDTMAWNIYIGGGSYDEEGNQKQIGKWVVLDEGFYGDKLVTYNGDYNLNGMKIGRWNIMYSKNGEKEYMQIGGGSYDQEGNQKKIGNWIELYEGFKNNKQITYNGEYNMNGQKVGIWLEMDIEENKKRREQSYN